MAEGQAEEVEKHWVSDSRPETVKRITFAYSQEQFPIVIVAKEDFQRIAATHHAGRAVASAKADGRALPGIVLYM